MSSLTLLGAPTSTDFHGSHSSFPQASTRPRPVEIFARLELPSKYWNTTHSPIH
jgi:hypothetical protein